MNKQKSNLHLKNSKQELSTSPFKSLHSSICHQPQNMLQILQNFIPIDQCPYHDLDIQFCCFDCKQMCCCSKCLIAGKHQTHDVKNIHRGYCMVQALLNQFTVKLTAKAELYSLWHEKISISKSELIEDFMELKKMVNTRFVELRETLEKKNNEVIEQIQQLKAKKQEFLSDYLNKLRSKVKLNHDSQTIVTTNIQQLSEPSLCKYYSEMKQHLNSLVQEDIEQELKSLTIRPKYSINSIKLQSAKECIEDLTNLYFLEPTGAKKTKYRAHFNVPISLPEQIDISSQSMVVNKKQRDSYHSPHAVTPKNVSEFMKDFDFYSKVRPSFGNVISKSDSKKTLKLFSATSSPFKDKKESPLHYLELQKKCFIRAKHND